MTQSSTLPKVNVTLVTLQVFEHWYVIFQCTPLFIAVIGLHQVLYCPLWPYWAFITCKRSCHGRLIPLNRLIQYFSEVLCCAVADVLPWYHKTMHCQLVVVMLMAT